MPESKPHNPHLVRLTKIEAATVQLDLAIELCEQGRFLPAITLAGAAEEVLGRQLGADTMFEELVAGITHDSGKSRSFVTQKIVNNCRNWLKHWDANEPAEAVFDLELEATTTLSRALVNLSAHSLANLEEIEAAVAEQIATPKQMEMLLASQTRLNRNMEIQSKFLEGRLTSGWIEWVESGGGDDEVNGLSRRERPAK